MALVLSNRYTKYVIEDHLSKNAIQKLSSKLVDILVHNAAYTFMDKQTMISTITYKNKDYAVLKVFHLKSASFDVNTLMRAKIAFFNYKNSNEEIAIHFLSR